MSELRECPCGRPAQISSGGGTRGRMSIHCDDQECRWTIVGLDEASAISDWNRRPHPAPVGVSLDDVRRMRGITDTTQLDQAYRAAQEELLEHPQPGAVVGEPVVRFNDDGTLDELVGTGDFHLEQMDSNKWWMQLGPHMVTLTARGKISAWLGKNEARTLTNTDKGSAT